MSLVESVLAGQPLALARLLSLVENGSSEGRLALDELFPHTGKAHLVGVTGGTGTGKSSLVNRLALQLRKPPEGEPRRVAILAVDPSSPFTGGAILGDRIRMGDLSGDSGVFIRSMATRGSLGGLAHATAAAVQVFDAAGFDLVLIETVGAGQSEVEIVRLAHTTLVVEAPGLGDDIQAIKAGILEIADILVVNKADLPGAEKTERALRAMLGLAHPIRRNYASVHASAVDPAADKESGKIWIPPVLRTVALEGGGVPELVKSIDRHADFLKATGEWQRRDHARLEVELEAMLTRTLLEDFRTRLGKDRYAAVIQELAERRLSPGEAVKFLLSA